MEGPLSTLECFFHVPLTRKEALMNAPQMSSQRSAYSLILTINITALHCLHITLVLPWEGKEEWAWLIVYSSKQDF